MTQTIKDVAAGIHVAKTLRSKADASPNNIKDGATYSFTEQTGSAILVDDSYTLPYLSDTLAYGLLEHECRPQLRT